MSSSLGLLHRSNVHLSLWFGEDKKRLIARQPELKSARAVLPIVALAQFPRPPVSPDALLPSIIEKPGPPGC